ncbi:APC family permease [Sulfuracidifex tepidarius]|uniref:Amino acid permease/ SLC12A domain-containing protein n=1 Tax=Sulfuracidifex tepidarius TaxID=1294262 RepID=A0A510E1M0_9CREN|nr:APC family permease [Sulfuracidifex tepidarius]BBG23238.1 hypothetical protein IC006_0522 [Sulfuracidifex tepidarius]BBG25988.1 hypothetical protein IC007_0493 [Sulfuracidifex tepidarius]
MVGLRKTLNRWELTYLSLGGIIGSGWLFAPLAAAAYAGPASVVAWILGGVMMMVIALSYAEISSSMPMSGGIVRYPHVTHGKIVGFVMSWIYLISAISTVAIEAVATTTYLSHYFPSLYSGGLTPLGIVLTYVLLAIFFLVNYAGVKFLGRVSHGLGWWKLLIPTLTSVLLLFEFNQGNFSTFIPKEVAGPQGLNAILFAIPSSGIIFSYLGFRQAIEYGGEGRNPQRDIPFALISSLMVSMGIFSLLQLAFIGALNWNVAGLPVGDWGGLLSSPMSDSPIISAFYEGSILTYIWVSLLTFDAIFSPAGTGIIYTGTTTRTFYASSLNGYIPENFSRVNSKGIPTLALIATVISSAIFLLPIPSWYSIVDVSTSATVLTYVMGGIDLQVFREKLPEMRRPFSLKPWKLIAPLSTVMAGLLIYWSGFSILFYIGVAMFSGMIAFSLFPRSIWLASIPLTGTLLGAYYLTVTGYQMLYFGVYLLFLVAIALTSVRFSKFEKEEKRASYWLIFMMVTILLMSYFGPFGVLQVMVFPYDVILVSLVMLAVHFVATRSSLRDVHVFRGELEQGTQEMT